MKHLSYILVRIFSLILFILVSHLWIVTDMKNSGYDPEPFYKKGSDEAIELGKAIIQMKKSSVVYINFYDFLNVQTNVYVYEISLKILKSILLFTIILIFLLPKVFIKLLMIGYKESNKKVGPTN